MFSSYLKKNKLQLDYATKLAKAEAIDFKIGFYKKNKNDLKYYNGNLVLMKQHTRFLNYIYSTSERYMVHRSIIIYYYDNIPLTSAKLLTTLNISRTSLKNILSASVDEGWIKKYKNKLNKREKLIRPTSLRINFWLFYCKRRYENTKLAGLNRAINALDKFEK